MLLVSSCLLGVNAKYNGSSNRCPEVLTLAARVPLVPVCPEQLGGLATPRPAAEILGGDGSGVLAGKARVLTACGEDRSGAFIRGAKESLFLAKTLGVKAALLKARSPSCGNEEIYDGSFKGCTQKGAGVTAAMLAAAGIRVFNETQLDDLIAYLDD